MSDAKTKTILMPYGDALAFFKAPENPLTSLPKGVYKVDADQRNQFYTPIKVTNDRPIEIGNMPGLICNEIATFFKQKAVFEKYGFAHKRGFLLYGEPGHGKSSLLRLLEERFIEQFDGVVFVWDGALSLSAIVKEFRKWEPDRSLMVVAEDIDGQLSSFEDDLTELLDGQEALNSFVLVATTNYLSAIPDRIKNRPSRIDRLIEVPPPPPDARLQYLIRIGLEAELANTIAKAADGFSMAALKEVALSVVCLGVPVAEVVERLKDQNAICVKAAANNKRNRYDNLFLDR